MKGYQGAIPYHLAVAVRSNNFVRNIIYKKPRFRCGMKMGEPVEKRAVHYTGELLCHLLNLLSIGVHIIMCTTPTQNMNWIKFREKNLCIF